jgi:4-diphosphocytidyl-2-C-methyl-D-erythritol kinase
MMPVTLAAPAKLNLYLHVTGKRSDSYHLLDGLVAFADVGDRLTISASPSLDFTASGPFAAELGGDQETNLVVRAARELARAAGRQPYYAFHLTKNLPVASGIGGGSADAAACLRGLAQLWEIDPASDLVRKVAEGLGADVPVCVDGRAVFMGGIGTDLAAAPALPQAGLLLVNPGVALPTPSVYRTRQGGFSPPMRFDDPPPDAQALADLLADRHNDLTSAAVTLVPAIDIVLRALEHAQDCLLARMSGSGATCFGIFPDLAKATDAGAAIAADHPGWWIAPSRLVEDARSLDCQAAA